jgi:hypothetical protein
MSSKYLYEDRIVAFIDILGFKNKINDTISGSNNVQSQIDKIIQAYDIIRNSCGIEIKNEMEKMIRKELLESRMATIFSDSIIISFLTDNISEISFTFIDLQRILDHLVHHHFICRGALTCGKMIHTKDFCFGPAFVEAYEMEKKAALYPRIIISEDLMKKFKQFEQQPALEDEMESVKNLLKQDTDGMYYIDYFENIMGLHKEDKNFPKHINKISTFIKKEIQSIKPPDVKIKYMWMRDKVNKVIEKTKKKRWLTDIRNITNQERKELANIYASLQRIP